MNDEEEMIFLHINYKNDIEEDLIDEYEAEYIFSDRTDELAKRTKTLQRER